jgi:hypothetical protein
MDIQRIVAQLKQEASRIENAIAALVGLSSQPARRGRPPNAQQAAPAARPSSPKRRRMSPAARKRISAAMKQRWAKWGGKSASKKVAAPARPAKKFTGRRPMSPAMKKKLSRMMKARWAALKTAA